MYKMQMCNAYTQEVLRETELDNPDGILSLIETAVESVEQGQPSFIMDDQQRTLRAEYVTYTKIDEVGGTTYKIFFKVKLSQIQIRVVEM